MKLYNDFYMPHIERMKINRYIAKQNGVRDTVFGEVKIFGIYDTMGQTFVLTN